MFRELKKTKAQVFSEYALLIAMVVMAVVAMSVFVKRMLQARIKETGDTVYDVTTQIHRMTNSVGNVLQQYEPYYQKSVQTQTRNETQQTNLTAGGTTGRFEKRINATIAIEGESEELPPRDAD